MNDTISHPENENELAEFVRTHRSVVPCGNRTKTAMSDHANISVSKLSGIVEYDPSEFTFTAGAGTTIAEINKALQSKGQYLPFDPPTFDGRSTLGGIVASGLSGSGRFRFGGLRDFLIAIRMVTGNGEIIRGGAPVVKNAAGFDLPKLLIGSRGRIGMLTQASFKVFPEPQESATILVPFENHEAAIELVQRLANSTLELHCLDLDHQHGVWIRVRGFSSSMADQIRRLEKEGGRPCTIMTGEEDQGEWSNVANFQWAGKATDVAKVALTPQQLPGFAKALSGVLFRVVSGGQFAWIAWPKDLDREQLQAKLSALGRRALFITGTVDRNHPEKENEFYKRIKSALDPGSRFGGHDAA